MALISCPECGKQISDKAAVCIGCGAPLISASDTSNIEPSPESVTFDANDGTFGGTKVLISRLAAKAIIRLKWKVDSIDETGGLVGFTTGITWGSFSGVSGSLFVEEAEQGRFTVSGSAKQNLRGGQLVALNLFDESGKKVRRVIDEMKALL